jgi:hypothetical protein
VYFPNKILGQMSKNRDLLKEAIEDAKVVKETAIASAKAALEEHFTPQLKSMLSAKLAEMEEMDVEEAEMDDMEEMYSKKEENLMGYKPVKKEEIEYDHGNIDTKEGDPLDELNLDELLAELEADMKDENMHAEDDEMKKEELNEAEGEEEVETEEEINIEDMTEEELKSFIEDVIKDMVEAGELEAGEGMEGEEGGEEEMEASEEEEVSIDEILAEIELDEAKKKGDKEDKKDKEEMTKLKKELEEAMSTIATMRTDINEVNLLNAKLLYTNKIFKAKNLTESQKVKVLNAFDKASTVKETKLVFETLSEGLKETSKSHVNESLKTSLASKTTGIMPTARKPIVEVNDTFRRMQKIAGIIK